MTDNQQSKHDAAVDELYAEAEHWQINTGDETIHAKRIPGKWRNLKWAANATWLVFFLGPYLRWGDRQAVLFDIPDRQFHIFGVTVLPQDFWMLSLTLLFFAILLAVVTTVAGRVYCGFFCFQTVWTDAFTWIENRLEGNPQKRRKLEQAPWDAYKIRVKFTKHVLWLLISALTGISFVAWFVDVYQLWVDIFTFNLGSVATTTILMFVGGTYILAGFLREQACFWLCPYARIQGVMVDRATSVPTYDFYRGEPRGRALKGKKRSDDQGDCVDCNQCVAVCPTGVDIRNGQQEGCIMCALCIDACDMVMEKVDRPKGLIRYVSLDELEGKEDRPIHKRPRVWVYTAILTLALSGIIYGLLGLDAIQMKVLHERQPLFVAMSDGSIQNKYTVKLLNKMSEDLIIRLTVEGPEGLVMKDLSGEEIPNNVTEMKAAGGKVAAKTLALKTPRENLESDSIPIVFHAETETPSGKSYVTRRESVFIGPQ